MIKRTDVTIYVPETDSLRIFKDIYNDPTYEYQDYRNSLERKVETFYSKWPDGEFYKNGVRIHYDDLPDNVKAAFLLCD